jgi:hypothetical protein
MYCSCLSKSNSYVSLVRLVSQLWLTLSNLRCDSGGAYRNVFGVDIPDTDEHVVFKECGFDDDHTFSFDDYEFMRYVL